MALVFEKADERNAKAEFRQSIAVFGPPGVGKTSLIRTLPDTETLVLDLEAGMKSVQGWNGVSMPIRAYTDFRDFAVLLGGPDPSAPNTSYFSTGYHAHISAQYKGTGILELLASKRIIFIDSITDLTRQIFAWAKQQPESFNVKGEVDTRGTFGLVGRETIQVLKHLQHTPDKTVIFVGVLEQVKDDAKQKVWQPQMEGSKGPRELPGIVDQVITMHHFAKGSEGVWFLDPDSPHRRLVCRAGNRFGLPAKDRSTRLAETEPPDLGRLLAKMNGKPVSEEATTIVETAEVPTGANPNTPAAITHAVTTPAWA